MVADGTASDIDAAIAAARRAFDETTWSTDVDFRVRCLRQLQAAFVAHADELRATTVAETGSPVSLTYSAQLDDPVASLGWMADLAEGYAWETDLGDAAPLGIPSHRWVRREPTGVVGAITPWNVPHQINLAKLGPALAAGNTVVLKPAPDTPWCATVLGRLIAEQTDIPAGVVNIVPSSDHRIGAALAVDPRVDQVSFTGSTATGRQVMAAASATVKQVFLELGGKSAFVVLDDADLKAACATAAFTVCTHAGQGCAITTRLLVPRRRLDDATEATAKVLAKLPAADPTDPGTICGPLISDRQRQRVEGTCGWPPRRGPDGRRRRSAGRPGPRLLHRADADRRALERRPGGPGRDLRPRPRRHPPRRRRRRDRPGQRIRLRAVRGRCGPATVTAPSASPTASGPARSASTAVSGTARTSRSAATSSPASEGRWAWPVSRSTCRRSL